MSNFVRVPRLAKKPVEIPTGVKVILEESSLVISGILGTCYQILDKNIEVLLEVPFIRLRFLKSVKKGFNNSLLGTSVSLLKNNIKGVSSGFSKVLCIRGIGYNASVVGKNLNLNLGYSHIVVYKIPMLISITASKDNNLTIMGISKQLVGQVSSDIVSKRPVSAYKERGIFYLNDKLVFKEVKKK